MKRASAQTGLGTPGCWVPPVSGLWPGAARSLCALRWSFSMVTLLLWLERCGREKNCPPALSPSPNTQVSPIGQPSLVATTILVQTLQSRPRLGAFHAEPSRRGTGSAELPGCRHIAHSSAWQGSWLIRSQEVKSERNRPGRLRDFKSPE